MSLGKKTAENCTRKCSLSNPCELSVQPGNTKGGSITEQFDCLTGLESAV